MRVSLRSSGSGVGASRQEEKPKDPSELASLGAVKRTFSLLAFPDIEDQDRLSKERWAAHIAAAEMGGTHSSGGGARHT